MSTRGRVTREGTDVIILKKYFCRKIEQKYWRFRLKQSLIMQKMIITLVFEKNANFVAKIVKNRRKL
jgi:hypothetical protein